MLFQQYGLKYSVQSLLSNKTAALGSIHILFIPSAKTSFLHFNPLGQLISNNSISTFLHVFLNTSEKNSVSS